MENDLIQNKISNFMVLKKNNNSQNKMVVKIHDTSLNKEKLDNNNNNNENLNKMSFNNDDSITPLNQSDRNNFSPNSLDPSFEKSLIQIHKFFKEQKIYTDPNDNYKRRTIVLLRTNNGQNKQNLNLSKNKLSESSLIFKSTSSNKTNGDANSMQNCNEGEFGFNLQSYGLLNSHSKQTEYICFVDNVQPKSPAKRYK